MRMFCKSLRSVYLPEPAIRRESKQLSFRIQDMLRNPEIDQIVIDE
jgi:hypothetical protein